MIKAQDIDKTIYKKAIEGTSGRYELVKTKLKDYTIVKSYDSNTNRLLDDVICGDFPLVSMRENGLDWMTNRPSESLTYTNQAKAAKGRVLMCGMGIGLFPFMVLNKNKNVSSIDVVELERDVINLVNPYLPTLVDKIMCGDAWSYIAQCGKIYDYVFLDIWAHFIEAIAFGPLMRDFSSRCLAPKGTSSYWLEEIGDNLEKSRGVKCGNAGPCYICGKNPCSGLYGHLCAECAGAYEYDLVQVEKSKKLLESI